MPRPKTFLSRLSSHKAAEASVSLLLWVGAVLAVALGLGAYLVFLAGLGIAWALAEGLERGRLAVRWLRRRSSRAPRAGEPK